MSTPSWARRTSLWIPLSPCCMDTPIDNHHSQIPGFRSGAAFLRVSLPLVHPEDTRYTASHPPHKARGWPGSDTPSYTRHSRRTDLSPAHQSQVLHRVAVRLTTDLTPGNIAPGSVRRRSE